MQRIFLATLPLAGGSAKGHSRILAQRVMIAEGEPAEVPALDGVYRLKVFSISRTSARSGSGNEAPSGILDISTEGWPAEIEISGSVVELPPLSVRQIDRIDVVAPKEMQRVDLNRDTLEWQPVPGAAVYEVQLGRFTDSPVPTSTWFTMVATDDAKLSFAKLSDEERATIGSHWSSGRIAGFRVQALDASRERIAEMTRERRFLVVGELAADDSVP